MQLGHTCPNWVKPAKRRLRFAPIRCPSLRTGGHCMAVLIRLLVLVVVGLSLGACANSEVMQRASVREDAGITGSVQPVAAPRSGSSYGVASYYSYPGRTASGEKYNPSQLTAAHKTLPFGTKLLVTNLNSGRSVVVRVNDRGPFVRGRVVDVSYSAAQQIGMVHSGIAKVKVEVLSE
jgi:rare lipoprotein A (peptidoglycan hydrolase)